MNDFSEYLNKTWNSADRELIFEFRIAKDFNVTPAVTALVYWRACANDVFQVVLEKFFQKVDFFHRYANGGSVRGTFQGVAFDGPVKGEELGIFGDIYYGQIEQSHFEGVMITAPSEVPVPPIPPIPPPDNAPSISDVTFPVHIGEVSDLFPYIYMHPWPRIGSSDLAENFVQFSRNSVTPPPQGNFFENLAGLKKSGGDRARSQMRFLAVAFIDGTPPWQGAFVENPRALPGPISLFADAVLLLRTLDQPEAEAIVEALEEALDLNRKKWAAYLKSTAFRQDWARVWYSFFALMIELGFDEPDLEALILTLVGAYILGFLVNEPDDPSPEKVLAMTRAHILLPGQVFPLPPGPAIPAISPPLTQGAIEPYAIGDLQMARQRLLGYRPGEIARIVNVLPGERRNTRSRQLNRVDESLRESRGERSENDNEFRESQTSLTEETQRALASNTLTTQYTDFKTTYGPPTVADLDGKWSVTAQPEAPSREDVTRFAKKILNRATTGLAREMERVRRRSSLNESEETADSLIDNSNGSGPLVGVFRWLNKRYRVYVVNYGTRLMIEFLVRDPAACYLARYPALNRSSKSSGSSRQLPHIQSPAEITPQNYLSLAALYGAADVPPPPPLTRSVSAALEEGSDTKIPLPSGYLAVKGFVTFVSSQSTMLEGIVGRNAFSLSGLSGSKSFPMNGEEDSVAAAAMAAGMGSPPEPPNLAVSVEIACSLSPSRLQEWQLQVYRALLANLPDSETDHGKGPLPVGDRRTPETFRAIERYELQRDAVRLLFERHYALVGAPASPPVDGPPQALIDEPRYADFFQQAFEWSEMSWQLYEQGPCGGFSGHFNPWLEAYPGVEDRFTAFLEASAARILVPVRPSFNFAVLYFLSSGLILPLDNALAPVDPEDVSVANGLIEAFAPDQPIPQARATGESWEVTIPTSLQVMESGIETEPQRQTAGEVPETDGTD